MLRLQKQADLRPWRQGFHLLDSHLWKYNDANSDGTEALTIKVGVWGRIAVLQRLSNSEQGPKSPPGMPLSRGSAGCGPGLENQERCMTHTYPRDSLNYPSTRRSF